MFLLASELNGDTGLFDACESLLVNELSEASFEPEHFLAGAAKEELNGVKDVAFAWAIEASDGIELGVKAWDDGPVHIGFEAFEDDLFDVHLRWIGAK